MYLHLHLHLHLHLLALLTAASTILADGASILSAISSIANATASLDTTVLSFPPGILGLADVVPLLVASTKLLDTITSGTKVAEGSANLTVAEAVGWVQDIFQSLLHLPFLFSFSFDFIRDWGIEERVRLWLLELVLGSSYERLLTKIAGIGLRARFRV